MDEISYAGRIQVMTTFYKIAAQSVKGRRKLGVVTHSCNEHALMKSTEYKERLDHTPHRDDENFVERALTR